MAAKKSNPAMEFIVASLKKNPKISYQDLHAAAAKKRLKVYPIMYGRAQAMLGIVKQAPRGQGKAAKAKAAKSTGMRRGPGRPRKNPEPTFDGSLESIVAAVKNSERAKARYRGALERIQSILADALAD
ncbi:MAG TPA: hypothetical protein ENI87_13760 [bacterium]|nr:hypothetical protein [bacterium]